MMPAALTWSCVLLTVALTVFGQTLQKQLALRSVPGSPARRLVRYVRQPLFWGAVASLAAGLGSWLVVLHGMDVGKAYPLLSVNYVVVVAVGRWWFREPVTAARWLGVAAIVLGLALVTAS